MERKDDRERETWRKEEKKNARKKEEEKKQPEIDIFMRERRKLDTQKIKTDKKKERKKQKIKKPLLDINFDHILMQIWCKIHATNSRV